MTRKSSQNHLYTGYAALSLATASRNCSTKERLKVTVQHGFEFMHEQPPLSLLCLQYQPEDRSEDLDTHRGAQSSLRRREVWGTYLKAELKAGLQLFRQIMSQTRHLQRWRSIEKNVESWMRKMKREQCVNDLIKPGGEGKRCAGPLALFAEQAVRVSADPYTVPKQESHTKSDGACLRRVYELPVGKGAMNVRRDQL